MPVKYVQHEEAIRDASDIADKLRAYKPAEREAILELATHMLTVADIKSEPEPEENA